MYVDGLRNKYSYQAPAPAPANPPLKLTLLGKKSIKSPAFVSFDRGSLLVTTFAEMAEGSVLRLASAAQLFDRLANPTPDPNPNPTSGRRWDIYP